MKIFNDLIKTSPVKATLPEGVKRTPVKKQPVESLKLDKSEQMLPNEYSLQKSTARKSPTPSNSTLPGARAKRRTLRGSQAKAIERLSGIKKTPSKKIDSKITLE